MEEPTARLLEKEITDILKGADLTKLSSKKVRLQLSEKFGCNLQHRKDEIDNILMSVVDGLENSNSTVKEEKVVVETEHSASSKSRTTASTKSSKKQKSAGVSKLNGNEKSKSFVDDSDEDVDMDAVSDDHETVNDEELARKLHEEENGRRTRQRQPQAKKPKNNPKKNKVKTQAQGGPKKITKFNEPLILSPALAEIVGHEPKARHEVVKRMWEIIKERNLYDPKNKQFMICDDQLRAVMGGKRIRIFGMLKHLSKHMSRPNADLDDL